MDIVLISLAHGFVGDNPNEEQRRLYSNAYEQIERNISVLKAGMSFRELSEKCWHIPDEFCTNRYPEIIHGVGLADEYPIVYHIDDFEVMKYEGIIEPGMTLCVESYIGSESGHEGVKLEEQVLVSDLGVERLSSYPFQLDIL